MGNLFAPVKDLVGSLYDFLYDAAGKVWNLAKPIIMIGLLVDLVTAKLGWISMILGFFHQALNVIASASWIALLFFGVVVLAYFSRNRG